MDQWCPLHIVSLMYRSFRGLHLDIVKVVYCQIYYLLVPSASFQSVVARWIHAIFHPGLVW
jgi:hypothetical protein